MIESLFLPLMLVTAQPSDAPSLQTSPSAENAAAPAKITQEDRAALRCSAAFAIVGARTGQADSEKQWPQISERGREFFVVALAGIMDERGLDRAMIEREVRSEAAKLVQSGEVDKVMPACLLMLQAAGL
jgi:hypothetical protein